jgi:hypothetical protein
VLVAAVVEAVVLDALPAAPDVLATLDEVVPLVAPVLPADVDPLDVVAPVVWPVSPTVASPHASTKTGAKTKTTFRMGASNPI